MEPMQVDGEGGEPSNAPPVVDVEDVDVGAARTSVYLVKMPKSLLEVLRQRAESGGPDASLGALRLPTGLDEEMFDDKDEPAAKRPRAEIEIPAEDASKPPATYELALADERPSIQIFSRDRKDTTGKMVAEGSVTYQCVARPPVSREYLKQHASRSVPKSVTVGQLGDREARQRDALASRPLAFRETAEMREERKRARERIVVDIPEEQWRERANKKVFDLFARRSFWRFSEIQQETQEPPGRMKNLVNELCTYMKSGPFSGHYHLLDELRTDEQRTRAREDMANKEQEQRERERARMERDGLM